METLGPINRLADFAGIGSALLQPYLLSSSSVPELCLAFQSLGDDGRAYAVETQGFLYDYMHSWLVRDPELLELINEYRASNGVPVLEE